MPTHTWRGSVGELVKRENITAVRRPLLVRYTARSIDIAATVLPKKFVLLGLSILLQ